MIVSPNKDQVRDWMRQRQAERRSPPDIETIRRELGWGLVREKERPARAR